MSRMRRLVLTFCVSAGMVSAACADEAVMPTNRITFGPIAAPPAHVVTKRKHLASHARPHDRANVVAHVMHAEGHEAAISGVNRIRPNSLNTMPPPAQRVAILDRSSGACDSLLCPGYAMLGVGF